MRRRPWLIWLFFAGGVAIVLAAMGALSLAALELEGAEARAARLAARGERIRLALWRMDSTVAPLIARESARPYYSYNAFYSPDRAYNRMFEPLRPSDVLVPSPLLTFDSPLVRLHFHVAPDGQVTSPQAPTGNQRDLAEAAYLPPARVAESAERLKHLAAVLDPRAVLARLADQPPTTATGAGATPDGRRAHRQPVQAQALQPDPRAEPQVALRQRELSEQEWKARREQFNANANAPARQTRQRLEDTKDLAKSRLPAPAVDEAARPPGRAGRAGPAGGQVASSEVHEGPMQALWAGGELLLVRRVRVNGQNYLQGAWLDWPAVRQWLAESTADLLPQARLLPAAASGRDGGEGAGRPAEQTGDGLLATLPAALSAGRVPAAGLLGAARPVRWALLAAWAGVLVGSAAVGAALHAALTLSRRRGDFVSAVTHEMRTPLTTFQLYTDLLADGLVAEPQKQRGYLRRLQGEAQRLSHLVENVLAYARLSGARAADARPMPLGEVLDGCRERLEARAQRDGLDLTVTGGDAAAEAVVVANPSYVEQILLNLVDNACKYARVGPITVSLAVADGHATCCVQDQGPGLSAEARRKLFRPFARSAAEAAGNAPGVGLGLALSRQLARDMGGDLTAEPSDSPGGARFCIRLPRARQGE